MTAVEQQQQAIDTLQHAAVAAFAAGISRRQALIVLGEAQRAACATERAARPGRVLKGCPSEAAYRRHLKAGEQCTTCREFMYGVERERRVRHPEWWV